MTKNRERSSENVKMLVDQTLGNARVQEAGDEDVSVFQAVPRGGLLCPDLGDHDIGRGTRRARWLRDDHSWCCVRGRLVLKEGYSYLYLPGEHGASVSCRRIRTRMQNTWPLVSSFGGAGDHLPTELQSLCE